MECAVGFLGLRAEVHGAQAEAGDFQAGAAQLRVLHAVVLEVRNVRAGVGS